MAVEFGAEVVAVVSVYQFPKGIMPTPAEGRYPTHVPSIGLTVYREAGVNTDGTHYVAWVSITVPTGVAA